MAHDLLLDAHFDQDTGATSTALAGSDSSGRNVAPQPPGRPKGKARPRGPTPTTTSRPGSAADVNHTGGGGGGRYAEISVWVGERLTM